MTADPGLADQRNKRMIFRALGLVLGIGGVLVAGYGFIRFVSGVFGETIEDGQMGQAFLMFAIGAVAMVVGLLFLNLGYLGATARYAAGETMPVVRDSASYLSDGEGVLGVGRTAAEPAPKTGPFCGRCHVQNDESARFCDACGTALA